MDEDRTMATEAPDQPPAADPGETGLPDAAAFFALAIAISASLWAVLLLDLPLDPGLTDRVHDGFLLAGGFGPPIAAVLLVRYRKAVLVSWLRRRFRLSVGRRWYALALVAPFALHAGTMALYALLGGELLPGPGSRPALWLLPFLVVHHTLIAGGNEELGWRGYALPALAGRVGLYPAAVVVGLGWGVWHYPIFELTGIYALQWFPAFVAKAVAVSIVLAVFFDATEGSVVPVMVFHGTWNALAPYRPVVLRELSAGDVTLHFGAELVLVWVGALVALTWHHSCHRKGTLYAPGNR